LPDRSKENTRTKRDTQFLHGGGCVDGPAPHHPTKTHTHAKNLDKGSEKRAVYLINYIEIEKV
jgi:hypothetical protein